jgi:hypothetical protein
MEINPAAKQVRRELFTSNYKRREMEIRKLPSERAPKFPNQTAETLSRDSRHLLAAILNSIKTRYGILALLGIKRDAFACNFLIAPFVSFRVSACRLTNRRMILNLARAQNSSAPSVCAEPRSVCVCVFIWAIKPRGHDPSLSCLAQR